VRHETARAVALRILDACFAGTDPRPAAPGLEPFQAHALDRLRDVIERRGGAILADSVGLGKTHVAGALIRAAVAAGDTALVAAPAQLRAHWTRHLRGLPRCRWISHTALSRGARRIASAELVVVDEAHAFRNPQARRYAALALLCADARVLLVTATPVNNSLLDFYHLVRLFAARDLFADIGVPDLLAAVESAMHGSAGTELRRVADAVMIRRTRSAIIGSLGHLRPVRAPGFRTEPQPSTRLRFPACAPIEVVRYDLATARPELLDRVQRVIPALTFPAHCLDDDVAPRELMRLGLLKRLESSTWAMHASVRRHIRLLTHFLSAAQDGLLFDPRRDLVQDGDVDGAVQLSLAALALRPWPRSLDRARLIAAADRDLCALRELATVLSRASDGGEEPKLRRLGDVLDACAGKVLLFTEYQETARGLWRALAARPGIALVHGSDARLGRARAGRRTVVERFAPIANHARVPSTVETVRLLIATDVLAEGMNLQDAAVMISYDLPWNPVRLAQRIGRIDRLGSPHATIRAVAFAPDRGVDELLGLMKRIRRKLRHIRIIGGDAPWSLAGARRSARWMADIDAAGDARERAYALWRVTGACGPEPCGAAVKRGERTDAPSCGVTIATLHSQNHHAAALCCFRAGHETLLVLTSDTEPPRIGTAACWSILGDALSSSTRPLERKSAAERAMLDARDRAVLDARDRAVLDATDRAVLEAAALAASRRAIRALRRGHSARPLARHEPGAERVADVVRRWLADRPGAPSRQEAEAADAILRQLHAGGRAGTDIKLHRAIRDADSTDTAVQSLLDVIRKQGADQTLDPRAHGDLTVKTGRDPSPPDLLAVLLLLPCTAVRSDGCRVSPGQAE
jgi:hypothetical protein